MNRSTLGFPVLHHLPSSLKLMSMSSDAIQPAHPLLPLLLPSIFPSIRVFSRLPSMGSWETHTLGLVTPWMRPQVVPSFFNFVLGYSQVTML